jgi:hypothetical protein
MDVTLANRLAYVRAMVTDDTEEKEKAKRNAAAAKVAGSTPAVAVAAAPASSSVSTEVKKERKEAPRLAYMNTKLQRGDKSAWHTVHQAADR